MNKNIKRMFFVLTLVTLLVTVGSVCAADEANSTTATDNSVNDVATVSDSASDTVAAEPVQSTSNDNKVDTKTIEKEDKEIKKDSITIDGVTYNNIIENQEINQGFFEKPFINNCTINNIMLPEGGCINNSILNGECHFDNDVYVYNSTVKGSIIVFWTLTVDDNTAISPDATIDNQGGTIHTNNTNVLYIIGQFDLEDGVLNDMSIDRPITNNGKLTLNNVTLNNTIKNNGILIISNDCTFTDNFRLNGDGDVITNLTFPDDVYSNKINGVEYSQIITDQEYDEDIYIEGENYYFKNCSINNMEIILIDGVLTLENCVVNVEYNIEKQGDSEFTLNIINTTFNKDINLYGGNAYCEKINFSDFGISISHVETPEKIIPPVFGQPEIVIPGRSLGGKLIINDSDINKKINGIDANITIINSRINNTINTFGEASSITFDTETIFYPNANINCTNIIIDDINRVLPYFATYNDSYTLSNIIISAEKLNQGNLTLLNSTINNKIVNNGTLILNNTTINSTIDNKGVLYIDDDTILGENAQIIGLGTIVTNNITRLLPIIETITGNITISNVTLDKTYNFNGNITLYNSNIISTDNINYGLLNLAGSNVQINEESNWITNYGVIFIDENSNTTGNIINYGEVYNGKLPEDFSYDPRYHIINNNTINIYFDIVYDYNEYDEVVSSVVLSDLINEGDTLDFQGTISHVTGLDSLVINKPVNIITSTNDGRIEDFDSITYDNGASGSNVTGLYTYNTQFYTLDAHNMVFDNISNVVNSKRVGWGVGQTSIRDNSTNITFKNSYFYTKDNGGSSTFVLAKACNISLINSTIETDGMVGNLVYLTSYGVDDDGKRINTNNQIINNVLIGPTDASPICIPIMLYGRNNLIENNLIYYVGDAGISGQWNGETYIDTNDNTLRNNTHIKHKPTNELIIDTTNFTAGENTTIKASIYYTNKINTNLTKGKITFKVNGKTLKDENGKVIYAKVVNGTATIENYTVPRDWAKDGTTIQAVYSGSTECDKLTSEKTNITIAKAVPTLTTEDITATAGSKITLKATITDNDKIINTGKIVFKINGKTVKDENGKVIYAKVVNNTVEFEYTLPESYKTGSYNITATFISPDYDRLTDSKTIIITN